MTWGKLAINYFPAAEGRFLEVYRSSLRFTNPPEKNGKVMVSIRNIIIAEENVENPELKGNWAAWFITIECPALPLWIQNDIVTPGT